MNGKSVSGEKKSGEKIAALSVPPMTRRKILN